MTQEQIKEVVKITIDELTKRKLLQTDNYQPVLKIVEPRLGKFFKGNADGYNISYALHCLSDDQYIDLIYLQYRDGKTLEWIAEYYDVDISTIKRNKKRLIYKIYEYITRED